MARYARSRTSRSYRGGNKRVRRSASPRRGRAGGYSSRRASGVNTLRIVIEQPQDKMVARETLGLKPAPAPGKAKF